MAPKFSEDIQELIKNELDNKDYTKMSLEELIMFREEVVDKHHEYELIEKANKTLGNAAYGACANQYFYFFNPSLAEDITGECRLLTTTFWNGWKEYFHETIWNDTELQKKFNFKLDETKHDWYRQQQITPYSDTDSSIESTILSIKNDKSYTIAEVFNKCKSETGNFAVLPNGHELVEGNGRQVLNWTNDKKLNYVPIKYLIRHKVTKSKFKLKTKSGKEIIVTGDHSCVVFRDGKQLTIKAKDINVKTDKVLVVKNIKYEFEDLVEVTQLDDFEDEYVYDIEVDDESHTFIGNDILIHNSCYLTFGTLFKAMDKESQERYNTDDKKRDFIMDFCVNHMNAQNRQWCNNIYDKRFAKSIHNFELETIQKAGLFIAKKNNIKGVVWNKGKLIPCDNPKIEATGIELIKSTTPKIARDIQSDLILMLLYKYDPEDANNFMVMFNQKIGEYRKKFYNAPIEEISQSIGIGSYKKYVDNDTDTLALASGCPASVHSIARYNWMAHKNNQDNLKIYSGKIKYYNIRINKKVNGYFGFPAGELPSWAPPVDKLTQWEKNVINPINRFLTALQLPLIGATGIQQLSLF